MGATYKQVGKGIAVCPNCQKRVEGAVLEAQEKKGLSAAKLGAGVMTLGVSLLVTGVRSVDKQRYFKCPRCKTISEWQG